MAVHHARRSDRNRGRRAREGQLQRDQHYFWQATWRNNRFNLLINEGGVSGRTIYNLARGSRAAPTIPIRTSSTSARRLVAAARGCVGRSRHHPAGVGLRSPASGFRESLVVPESRRSGPSGLTGARSPTVGNLNDRARSKNAPVAAQRRRGGRTRGMRASRISTTRPDAPVGPRQRPGGLARCPR